MAEPYEVQVRMRGAQRWRTVHCIDEKHFDEAASFLDSQPKDGSCFRITRSGVTEYFRSHHASPPGTEPFAKGGSSPNRKTRYR